MKSSLPRLTPFQSCLIAIIVPDPETLPGYVKDKLNLDGSMEDLCVNNVSNFFYIHDKVFRLYTKKCSSFF